MTGMEITGKFCLSCGKVSKKIYVQHYFCLSPTVPDITISKNSQSFCLSFGKVPKIFTCLPLFLPDPDRRTVSNFHPWMRTFHCIRLHYTCAMCAVFDCQVHSNMYLQLSIIITLSSIVGRDDGIEITLKCKHEGNEKSWNDENRQRYQTCPSQTWFQLVSDNPSCQSTNSHCKWTRNTYNMPGTKVQHYQLTMNWLVSWINMGELLSRHQKLFKGP